MKEALCWTCSKALGGCSWSREFKPIDGWDAVKNKKTGAYRVLGCPEYDCDKDRYKEEKKA